MNKKNYCSNCAKFGHVNKKCKEPVTSIGIICVSIKNLPIIHQNFKKFIKEKYIEIDNYNFSNINNIDKLDFFKNNINFLMIRRKHSLSYIEFIRGKYQINNIEKLKKYFSHMSPSEIDNIKKLDFNYLWNNLWGKTASYKIFQKEYKNSKNNFNKLILLDIMKELLNIKPIYDCPEWGFPKGRRDGFEKNLDCAIREFCEETNLDINKLNLLPKSECIYEEYFGTNGIKYRHIYYLSLAEPDLFEKNISDDFDNYEVSQMGWISWKNAINLIRPYYYEKIKIVNQTYFLFINLYLEYLTNEQSDLHISKNKNISINANNEKID